MYGAPQFYAIKMYNDHMGTERLHVDMDSPKLEGGVPSVDAVATRSSDGRQLYVKVSNADKEHGVKLSLELAGFAHAQEVAIVLLSSDDPMQRNRFSHPDAVVPIEKMARCSTVCVVDLPADSIAVLTFHKR